MLALLKNEKFWLAVVALAQTLALNYFGVPQDVWQAVNAILLVVIAALAVEDGAKAIALEMRANRQAKYNSKG